MAFLFKGGRLIQVKITKKDKHGTATGWPRPLNRGGRLIQVPNTAFVCANNRDFKNWPLNRGWPLNTGPLYTGSTVSRKFYVISKPENACLTTKTKKLSSFVINYHPSAKQLSISASGQRQSGSE